jgi:hypothetical protein
VQQVMLADFVEGSDPGVAVALKDQVTPLSSRSGEMQNV